MLADEIRAWLAVLKHTEGILACATCREHYRAWRQKHPIEDFVGRDRDVFRELLRKWLWDLHEYVNDHREVPQERRLPFDALASYKEVPRQEIFQRISTLKDVLHKAGLHRQINPTYVVEWLRTLKFLQKLLF